MRSAAFLLIGLVACASAPPAPAFHDDKYLRFGVDPDQEAKDVIESQKERDYRVSQRLAGEHFTALSFMDKAGRSTAVRILTPRGVQVALDSTQTAKPEAATRYALLAPPIKDTHDADHDGFEEVFVEERTLAGICLRVYRVRDVGFVDRVYVDEHAFGQPVCARAAVDLDRDGVVELWTEVSLEGFPVIGAAKPSLSLPLWAAEHRFITQAGSQAQKYWIARERAQRQVALSAARQKLDLATCYVLAVELAGLEYLEHGDPRSQLAEFDRALNGLVLTQAVANATSKARARIYGDWNDPALQRPAASAMAQAGAKDLKPAATAAPRESKPAASAASASQSAGSARTAEQTAARPVASSKRASVGDLELQRALRAGAQQAASTASKEPSKPMPVRVPSEEPVLEEGDLLITPDSAAEYAKTHPKFRALLNANKASLARGGAAPQRAAVPPALAVTTTERRTAAAASATSTPKSRSAATPSAASASATSTTAASEAATATPPSAAVHSPAGSAPRDPSSAAADSPSSDADWASYRATARELGNAAVSERTLAAQARVSAASERREAQAARDRGAKTTDPAALAEARAEATAHVEAAQRYSSEAEDHAAQAAMHRAALAEHKELMRKMFGAAAAPP